MTGTSDLCSYRRDSHKLRGPELGVAVRLRIGGDESDLTVGYTESAAGAGRNLERTRWLQKTVHVNLKKMWK